MTVAILDLAFYAFALAVLVATPGPVVVATVARTLGSGIRSAIPLAAGVAVGDVLWPLLAIFGLSALATLYGEVMQLLRYVGAGILIWMGWRLIARPRAVLRQAPDPALMRRDAGRAFMAGLLVNLGNPKSIFFFMGLLPGFFHIATLTAVDVAIIVGMSAGVLLLGNILWALAAHWARAVLGTPHVLRRVDRASGGALIGAGAYIAAS
ncbi:MAG TPA: LysE family translocator [Paracoccaceae bacterium]|nr:LysE family translocator [Paracoccaceae bacterium]